MIIILLLIIILILIYKKEDFIPTKILTSYDNIKKNLDLFKIIKKILDINKIEYFIEGGGLLGICRNNKMMPWDDDIDIVILKKDINKLLDLREEFNKYNLDITTFFAGYKIYLKDGEKIKNYKFRYPFLDVFIGIEKDGKIVFTSELANKMFKPNYPIKEIYPLKEYNFEDIKVIGVNNIEKVCDLNFPNWRNYAIKTYDHTSHNRINKTEFDVDYNKKLFIWDINNLEKDIQKENINKYLKEIESKFKIKFNLKNINNKRLLGLFLLYQYGGLYIENNNNIDNIDYNLLNKYHIIKKDNNYAIRIGNKTLGEFLENLNIKNINNIFIKFDNWCKNDKDLINNNYYLNIKPYLWLYWEGKMPEYIKLCLKTIYHHNNQDFNIKLLNQNTIHHYLKSIHPKIDSLPIPQKTDYYRIKLLNHFGGIWCDADTIALKSFYPLWIKALDYDYVGFGCSYKKCFNGKGYPSNGVMISLKNRKLINRLSNLLDEKLNKNIKIEYFTLGKILIKEAMESFKDYEYYHYPSWADGSRDKNGKWIFPENYLKPLKNSPDLINLNKAYFIFLSHSGKDGLGSQKDFLKLNLNQLLKQDYWIIHLIKKSLNI